MERGKCPHRDSAYWHLQLQRVEQPVKPGVAVSLVRKLLAFNQGGAMGSGLAFCPPRYVSDMQDVEGGKRQDLTPLVRTRGAKGKT